MRRASAPVRPVARPLRVAAALALLAPAACGTPTAIEDGPVRVVADVAHIGIALVDGLVLPVTVTNAGRAPVGVMHCGPDVVPVLERRTASGWASYAGGICQAVYQSGLAPLAAGEERRTVLPVRDAGHYRVVLQTATGPVRSAEFDVR